MAGEKPSMRVSAKAKNGDTRVNLVAIWPRDEGRGYSAKLDRGVRVFATNADGEEIEIDPDEWWINFTDFRELASGGQRAPSGARPPPQRTPYRIPPKRSDADDAFNAPPPGDDDIPF